MDIIVGHTNMDLDCIGSVVLAKYLFPGFVPVRSNLIHPMARNLMNLYEDRLGFVPVAELKGKRVDRVVVVDARSTDRVSEYSKLFPDSAPSWEVFDHHPAEGRDIPGAVLHAVEFGANTSQLALALAEKGIPIGAEDATIALTGIYADTGNFTHANVAAEDFRAAEHLLSRGASLELVKDFLVPLKEKHQVVLFHEILGKLETRTLRGHRVQTCYLELEEDSLGLGAVVERVFEVENGELLFGFFFLKPKGKLLVIARNRVRGINLNEVLADFGGGGHQAAASASVKTEDGKALSEGIVWYLDRVLAPAPTAGDIMTEAVVTLRPDMKLLEASMVFEETGHTGAPVVDAAGALVGLLTLRDIMNGRKSGRMDVPVSGFMTRQLLTAGPAATLSDIDQLLFERNIGHLPIVANGRLAGIVTRTDLLDYKRGIRERKLGYLRSAGLGPQEA